MSLETEAIEKNFLLFNKKLLSIGVSEESLLLLNKNNLLPNATFAINADSGAAYDGSFVYVISRILTPYAVKINELLPEEMKVDKDSLVKVCFLHQISKIRSFVKNDNEWEVTKLGRQYKYSNYELALRMCGRSLAMCIECGIKFTEQEVEAMLILDRTSDDEQVKLHASPMAVIVKQASELTFLTLRNINNSQKTENK